MAGSLVALAAIEEDSLRERVVRLLKRRDYKVREASDGVEALELFRQQPCDLMIADIGLPSMNGVELLRQIRKLDSQVSLVIVTEIPVDGDTNDIVDSGASILFKPFRAVAFMALMYDLETARAQGSA